jgi:2-iminobutanoate/2-iminopropanoate deaminase
VSHHREPVSALGAPKAAGPYSHAIKSRGLLFCSGQTPIEPESGELVEGSVGEQTTRCLQNLQVVCAAAGASLEDAVRVGVFVTDMATFGEVNEAYAAFFEQEPPARTTIGVAALPLGAHVEIDAVVALPD